MLLRLVCDFPRSGWNGFRTDVRWLHVKPILLGNLFLHLSSACFHVGDSKAGVGWSQGRKRRRLNWIFLDRVPVECSVWFLDLLSLRMSTSSSTTTTTTMPSSSSLKRCKERKKRRTTPQARRTIHLTMLVTSDSLGATTIPIKRRSYCKTAMRSTSYYWREPELASFPSSSELIPYTLIGKGPRGSSKKPKINNLTLSASQFYCAISKRKLFQFHLWVGFLKCRQSARTVLTFHCRKSSIWNWQATILTDPPDEPRLN